MQNKYYQQELNNLREVAAEFSRENPAIAPMLGEPSSDPDVDRLLEGVAFLTGQIREKIDDEFPEIIHDLLRQIWPHYLRPLPSSTIIGFAPDREERQVTVIPSGIYVDSRPVEETACKFRTCYDVELPPVSIVEVVYEEPSGNHPVIRLFFEMKGMAASNWHPETLSFYLGGSYRDASDLYLVLMNRLKRIIIRSPESDRPCRLEPHCLKPAGFSKDQALIPYPSNAFSGYRLIQEYFLLPEKFLFLELTGWENWQDREGVTRFEVDFELNGTLPKPFKPDLESFVLGATPAINIFSHDAVPVIADHKKTEYRVRPAAEDLTKYQIYSIEKVFGYLHGIGKEVEFEPLHSFMTDKAPHLYHETVRKSPVRDGIDFNVAIAYPSGESMPELKTLSFDILCTNGYLPEWLAPGDICVPTASTPEFVSFKNLRKPTTAVLPPLGSNILWRLVSVLTLNYVSLTKPENLKSLLKLYLMEGNRDRKSVLANEKRIDGIKDLKTENVNRLVAGTMMRGVEVRMKICRSHFTGPGDLYLFGTVLDNFLGLYASINTFTRLVINEMDTGETFIWPARIGNQQLL